MPYIKNGQLMEGRPGGLSSFLQKLWDILMVIKLFFETLMSADGTSYKKYSSKRGWDRKKDDGWGGGGSGPGGGGGGGGGRRVTGMSDLINADHAAKCAGGG
eukprot:jgi/Botrbrau1/19408/Bobra.0338s0035.1